jgi:alpha-L-rhamnosidase
VTKKKYAEDKTTMKYKIFIALMALATGGLIYSFNKPPKVAMATVDELRCERLNNPAGIDVLKPRLSWVIQSAERNIEQVAYQVLVASSPEKLAGNKADIWNSGKVRSSQSVHVPYAGKTLPGRTACYWKVKVWTNKGETGWSETAFWSMGLLQSTDWQAKWIGLDKSFAWDSVTQWSRLSARYFRKPFTVNASIKKATAYIVGLGLYELYVNGKKIGDQVLAPAPTDYTKTVFYNTHDVTRQLQQGNNTVGVVLGNGRFFTMRQNYKPQKIRTFGFPKMRLQLEIEFTNGTRKIIASDETWKVTADGPIRSNNEYDGEEYDATKELTDWNKNGFNDNNWLRVELVKAPGGVIRSQVNANMKVMSVVKPVSIKPVKPGVFIMDMGQNMVGWIHMQVKGDRGQKVKLRFAESLQPNGELYVANLRDARVTDVYTLKGGSTESWQPSFVFHGFRYVEISGYPGTPAMNDFEGRVVYDDMPTTGQFTTSNETLNQIYKNAWWGINGNYKGMPIDCPQRNERQPWLGDRSIGSLGESFMFGNGLLYAKWLDDIEEAQTEAGVIPDVAPAFWNYYSDNMTWPGAYLTIADMLYTQYADKRPIEKHYASMRKWLGYMRGKYMKDFIVTKDKYGDWCVPPESPELIHSKDSMRKTDGPLIATAYYYRMLQYMQRFALLLNKPADAKEYMLLANNIKTAFNQRFYNAKKKQYSNNTVTANLLPLYFGMVPDSLHDAVFTSISNKILDDDHGHLSTGLLGTQWIMRGLSRYGRPDIAYTLATNRSYPSWGYMVDHGATTIWELWNGNTANPSMNSQNHVMLLGDLLAWCYENLAGIKSDSVQTGFKNIIMQPTPVDGLQFVKASYQSAYGIIKSEWQNGIDQFSWQVTIPANTKAMLYIPASSENAITENGKPVTTVEGIRCMGMQGKRAVLQVGSGNYHFVSSYAFKKGIVKDEFIFERAPFPESHAATIVETPGGLVTAWFGGTKERNPDVGIWLSRQVHDQWTAPVEVANGIINDTLRYACWNPVLYQVPNGELLLFYKTGPKVSEWKGWMITSTDNGVSWSKPKALPDGFIGPVKNKPVLLKNGELLCASSTEGNGWKVHFEITPDAGKTWTKAGPINDGKTINAIQPSVLFYPDGKLQILCRTRNRAIAESWSADNGKTWSPMALTTLPNNNSGTDAVTLRDGRQLLVYNHVLPPGTEAKGPRTPLNVAISQDGKTWSATLVLEDSPISQYSYPSVIQSSDGMIHFVYTWRRERIKYVKVDPTKLEVVPIRDGVWPGK